MYLNINNIEVVQRDDAPLLHACIDKAREWTSKNDVTLTCAPRRSDGWLEYGMNIVPYSEGPGPGGDWTMPPQGPRQYMACIERAPGAELEFHM